MLKEQKLSPSSHSQHSSHLSAHQMYTSVPETCTCDQSGFKSSAMGSI